MNESTLFKDGQGSLLPWTFFGDGPNTGPEVFMIDDSSFDRTVIDKAWPSAVVLLCTFHFLQRRWTWLQDGQKKKLVT